MSHKTVSSTKTSRPLRKRIISPWAFVVGIAFASALTLAACGVSSGADGQPIELDADQPDGLDIQPDGQPAEGDDPIESEEPVEDE